MDREILRGMKIVIGDRGDDVVILCEELGMDTELIGKYPGIQLRKELEKSETDFLLMHVADNLAVAGLILSLSTELQSKEIVRKRIDGGVTDLMKSAYRQLEAAGIYTTDFETIYPNSLEGSLDALGTILLDLLSRNESK